MITICTDLIDSVLIKLIIFVDFCQFASTWLRKHYVEKNYEKTEGYGYNYYRVYYKNEKYFNITNVDLFHPANDISDLKGYYHNVVNNDLTRYFFKDSTLLVALYDNYRLKSFETIQAWIKRKFILLFFANFILFMLTLF